MTTLTDTKFNQARIVSAAAGEPPVPEILITRPHADSVVTDNKDPDSMVDTSAERIASMDGSDGLATNARDNRIESKPGAGFFGGLGDNTFDIGAGVHGRIVAAPHEDLGSYVTDGTTGTVNSSGNHVRLTDITDGTSNTIAFARTDGNATSLLETMADDDSALFKGSVVNINAGGGWDPTILFESPQTEAADDSTAHRTGISDGTSNTIMIGELSATGNVIENVAAKYTMFDGEADGLLLGGNINNIDAWVGGIVLDVRDVLGGVDAADGNAPVQTRMADGSANLQPEPDGQANGIIAVLIGVSSDDQGPLNNGGLALD